MTNDRLYECSICKHINHVSRFHCQTCGTIPARYSFTGKPIREKDEVNTDGVTELWLDSALSAAVSSHVEVLVAFGAERIGFSHATKVHLRTVPGDYYAGV